MLSGVELAAWVAVLTARLAVVQARWMTRMAWSIAGNERESCLQLWDVHEEDTGEDWKIVVPGEETLMVWEYADMREEDLVAVAQ